MKFLVCLVIVLCLLVAGNVQGMNVWTMYEDAGFTMRLGQEVGSNIEIGIEEKVETDWDRPFQDGDYLGGIFAIVKFADENALLAPYIGGRILFDYEDDFGAIGGPVGGVLIGKLVAVEYQYQDWQNDLDAWKPDRHVINIGFKFRF